MLAPTGALRRRSPCPVRHPSIAMIVSSSMRLLVLLFAMVLLSPSADAAQRILLIRGLMDYMPGISPMTLLKTRLIDEGYDVTMITHLADGFYKDQRWDVVIGHSQGAIDALRDAPDLVRANPHLTIIAVDPPRTSVFFRCVPGVRYLDLHTSELVGLGGGLLSCPQASNVPMGGLHITLPMRSDVQERILAYLQSPTEETEAKPRVHTVQIKPQKTATKIAIDETSFDARFAGVWAAATNVIGSPVIPWTERSYTGVLFELN